MPEILQTPFSNEYFWKKNFLPRFKLNWKTNTIHCFRQWGRRFRKYLLSQYMYMLLSWRTINRFFLSVLFSVYSKFFIYKGNFPQTVNHWFPQTRLEKPCVGWLKRVDILSTFSYTFIAEYFYHKVFWFTFHWGLLTGGQLTISIPATAWHHTFDLYEHISVIFQST